MVASAISAASAATGSVLARDHVRGTGNNGPAARPRSQPQPRGPLVLATQRANRTRRLSPVSRE
jgi:hypothetical protein